MTEHNAVLTIVLFGIESLIGLAFCLTLGSALIWNKLKSRETNQ